MYAEVLKQVHMAQSSLRAPGWGAATGTEWVLSYVGGSTLTEAMIPANNLEGESFSLKEEEKKKIEGVSEIPAGPKTSLL